MSATRRQAVALLAAFATIGPSTPSRAESKRITFVLTNDIYLMSDEPGPDGRRRGGFPRLAAVVKAERAKGGHVLFAHGGDTLSPSLMSGIDHGAHIIRLTNMIPPDIFVPGNHEFDFGKDMFLQRMSEANFPLYAANLRDPDGAPLPKFKDREIITIDGVRVGLTGAAFDQSAIVSSPGNLRFARTLATMKAQAEALRKEGADFVVGVAHVTRTDGYAVLDTGLFDLLLTGHTHDLFINYNGRSAMVESSHDAHYVTLIDIRIDVKVDQGKRITTWWPEFRVIDTATITPDPAVAAVVAGYEAQLSQALDRPIGTTAVELDSRGMTVRTREAAIGALIADAMRDSAHAQAAITNGGGIRGGRIYPPGTAITRRDIVAELPFDNRVVAIDISGATLRLALENGLSQLPKPAGRFPQVSGLIIEADPSRPPGSRVLSVKVDGAPLNDSRIYRVATNDYMLRGGDDYTMLIDAPEVLDVVDAPLLSTDVIDYIQKIGTIRTEVGDRLVLK
jgi:2',3'-cyclic-nucleotide 2'-phosphodiesterase (5'-nucleotidase family)